MPSSRNIKSVMKKLGDIGNLAGFGYNKNDEDWACELCALVNPIQRKKCCACGSPRKDQGGQVIRALKAEGCRIQWESDGTMLARHPCIKRFETHAEDMCDRKLMNNDEKQELVENYIHSYARDLRDGVWEGTYILGRNLECQSLGPLMCQALVKAGIHNDILRFLNQCDEALLVVLKGVVGGRTEIPSLWMYILTMTMMSLDDAPLAIAEGIRPLVMCMTAIMFH